MSGKSTEVFSGHESFACRYGWLPKLYEAVAANPTLFEDDENAIVTLGIGKNMVRSIRFWGHAFGVLQDAGGRTLLTEFARSLLDPDHGKDPYLEEAGSLWRLHWNVTTHSNLAAWATAFLETQDIEVTKQRFAELLRQRALQYRAALSSGTISQHIEIFLHTYDASSRALEGAVLEDTLRCPLQELGLLEVVEPMGTPTIRFHRGPKPGIDFQAFAYALGDFWKTTDVHSDTLSLRSLMLHKKGPGTVFRLDEASVHGYLLGICDQTNLELVEDGVGGFMVTSTKGRPVEEFERVAWQ
jgi:hypothetical protein